MPCLNIVFSYGVRNQEEGKETETLYFFELNYCKCNGDNTNLKSFVQKPKCNRYDFCRLYIKTPKHLTSMIRNVPYCIFIHIVCAEARPATLWKPRLEPESDYFTIPTLARPSRTTLKWNIGNWSACFCFFPRVRIQPNALWLASIPSHPVS